MKRIGTLLFALVALVGQCATPAIDSAQMRAQVEALGRLTAPPAVHPAEGLIKPLFFDGLPWQGNPTRVYAWLGVPEKSGGDW